MRKLLILPGSCEGLGGTLVSLSMLLEGCKIHQMEERLCVLVRSGSPMEKYLRKFGQDYCLQAIPALSQVEFFKQAIQWVSKQPKDYPLLLDNCAYNYLLPTFLMLAPKLRLSGRSVYYFCHDLTRSNKVLGYVARKLIFSCLSPRAICNSSFTADNVRNLMPNIKGILYQPVNSKRFNDIPLEFPPLELQKILQSKSRIILTPSRINSIENGKNGDKNLRGLIPVLAHLKVMGYEYHQVIIGEDDSPDKSNSHKLLKLAEEFGVSDRFTILPATVTIEEYYKCADLIVTLAPREAFGRTVIEGLACGVPVIGSKTGGIGEIMSNFAPEWMVDPEDPKAAAETIVRVSTDANTVKVLEKARDWVHSECSVTSYAKKMMEITGIALPDNNKQELVKVS